MATTKKGTGGEEDRARRIEEALRKRVAEAFARPARDDGEVPYAALEEVVAATVAFVAASAAGEKADAENLAHVLALLVGDLRRRYASPAWEARLQGAGARGASRAADLEALAHVAPAEGAALGPVPGAMSVDLENDGRWIAEVEGVPGCLAYGATAEEAREKAHALAHAILAERARDAR